MGLMIKQPEPETRNVNNLFYASEQRRIDKLNQKFFQNIELTEKENPRHHFLICSSWNTLQTEISL